MKSVELLVKLGTTTEQLIDLNGTATIDVSGGTVQANNFTSPTIYVNGAESSTVTADTINHIIVTTSTAISPTAVNIGKIGSDYGAFEIMSCVLHDNELSASNVSTTFNSLATLPTFSFNATYYPANDTVYTSNIPYSSMVVSSGSFKINLDNELECITDGIVRMSCSHQFDESEYITLNIGGVKSSSTGSVTVGTIIASISQGSNVISIDMDAGDKLNRLDIQFRATVE
jgi:hypothetical protein